MAEPHEFCVMLQIRTTDPRLSAEALTEALDSGEARHFAFVRRAMLQRLPKDVARLVAVFPVEHAKLLMLLHEAMGDDIAAHLRAHGIETSATGVAVRPPPDYVPPTRD